MYRYQNTLLVCLTFCWLTLPLFSQSLPCDLKKNEDGIKVYTCKTDSSKFRSLVAEFELENVSFEELSEFLWNVDNYSNWQYNMVSATLLKKVDENAIIYRSEVDAPWPVENREMIVQLSVLKGTASNQRTFTMHTVNFPYPENDALTRVPYSEARWTVKKVSAKLYIRYELNIDPGGYVPPLLVNLAMAEGPYQSFRNLKKLIETPR
jgi:hypothetical protein